MARAGHLQDSAPLPVSQLAHEVLSKQPTVTKLVQRMCEQGWLRLEADPATSAARWWRHGRRPPPGPRVLRPLGAGEKAALRKLLEKIAQHA
jgi:DNA-binding MurR/RpiR family transcriptional regulator